jgi:hypothetical protein
MDIYVREVVIGTQEKVIVWVDDEIIHSIDKNHGDKYPPRDATANSHRQLINYFYQYARQMNVSFIFHSNVNSCAKFVRESNLFAQNGMNFKFIVNQTLADKPKAGCLLLCSLIKKQKLDAWGLAK